MMDEMLPLLALADKMLWVTALVAAPVLLASLAVGLAAQQRADGGVDLGVHQHEVLATLDRVERDRGAVVDRPGDVDEAVDLLGTGEQRRVVRHRRPAPCDDVLQGRDRVGRGDVGDAGVPAGGHRTIGGAVAHRCDPHARHRGRDLIDERRSHGPGAVHPDANGTALALARLECGVDEDHVCSWLSEVPSAMRARRWSSCSPRSGHAASFGEIDRIGAGQSMASAGSSQRRPPSSLGV